MSNSQTYCGPYQLKFCPPNLYHCYAIVLSALWLESAEMYLRLAAAKMLVVAHTAPSLHSSHVRQGHDDATACSSLISSRCRSESAARPAQHARTADIHILPHTVSICAGDGRVGGCNLSRLDVLRRFCFSTGGHCVTVDTLYFFFAFMAYDLFRGQAKNGKRVNWTGTCRTSWVNWWC